MWCLPITVLSQWEPYSLFSTSKIYTTASDHVQIKIHGWTIENEVKETTYYLF